MTEQALNDQPCEVCGQYFGAIVRVVDIFEIPSETIYRAWETRGYRYFCLDHKRSPLSFYMGGHVCSEEQMAELARAGR